MQINYAQLVTKNNLNTKSSSLVWSRHLSLEIDTRRDQMAGLDTETRPRLSLVLEVFMNAN